MATFEKGIEEILGESVAIATQRGGEYGDSWATENLVTTFTKTALKKFGVELTDEQIRLVQMGALVDVKDARLIGPYKEDSVVDGINYRAVYAYLMRLYNGEVKENLVKDTVTGTVTNYLAPCQFTEGDSDKCGQLANHVRHNVTLCSERFCDGKKMRCHTYVPQVVTV